METKTQMPAPKTLFVFLGVLVAVIIGAALFSSGGSYEDRRDDAERACIGQIADPAEHEACIDYEMGR